MSKQTQPSAALLGDGKQAQIQDLLSRMQELAQQAASGKCTPEQCAGLQKELVALRSEIERITDSPA